jgi:LEA14-like dessication related protein
MKRNPVTEIVPLNAKRARRPVVRAIAAKIKAAQAAKPNSSGSVRIIDEEKLIYPWLTHDMVYSSLRRLKSKEQSDVQAAIACAAVDNQINVMNINGGRPVGSTNEHIQTSLDLKMRAKDEMAILYDAEKKRNGGSLKRGSFKDIHQCVIQRLGINDPNFKVSVKSIQTRVYRNSINVMNINGGRPAGSTNEHIQTSLDLKMRAKDEMAILYDAEKKRNGGSLKRGSFKDIHQCVIQRLGINDPNFKVSVKSIQTRVYRNSLTVDEFQNQPVKSNSSRNQPAR